MAVVIRRTPVDKLVREEEGSISVFVCMAGIKLGLLLPGAIGNTATA